MRKLEPRYNRKRASLTDEERREIHELAASMAARAVLLRMNPETVANIITPYGRACGATIERVRARLAELRENKTGCGSEEPQPTRRNDQAERASVRLNSL